MDPGDGEKSTMHMDVHATGAHLNLDTMIRGDLQNLHPLVLVIPASVCIRHHLGVQLPLLISS